MNYYIKLNISPNEQIDDIFAQVILFRLYAIKQDVEYIPYDLKMLSKNIRVDEKTTENAIDLLIQKGALEIITQDQKFEIDKKNFSKSATFLDLLEKFNINNNDNIYVTEDNNITIDNTIPFFNSLNVKYKVLTKEKKEENNILNVIEKTTSIKEEKKENFDVQEVFDYFNSLGLKKMRALNDKTEKAIKKALKTYSKEKLFELMRRFKCIVKDEYYYYSYEWNVEEFFCRKEGYTQFDDDGSKWLSYLKARPIVKTNDFFEQLWEIYPNHNSIEEARKEYQNKFIGLKNSAQASQKADEIYELCADYIEDTDPLYVMSLNNWLRANIKNGVFEQ